MPRKKVNPTTEALATPDSPRFPKGHQRQDWPKLYGWADVLARSGRVDYMVRQMRNTMEDFPEPIAVLDATPVYLALEIDAFFDLHPVQKRKLRRDDILRIYTMHDNDISVKDICRIIGCTDPTVYKYLKLRRSRPASYLDDIAS